MDEGDPPIVMRMHRVRAELVVAACDADLIGRALAVGDGKQSTQVSAQFYGDRRVHREELLWAIQRGTIVNLLGPVVCRVAQEAGLVSADQIGTLGGVPHAEIFSVAR